MSATTDANTEQSTAQQVKVVNSHSNLNPSGSFAYQTEPVSAGVSLGSIQATPISEDPDTNTLVQPLGLSATDAAVWLAQAKAVATEDREETGRVQEIIRSDATVAKIKIGQAGIPSVSATDVSSYQSWLTANDYKLFVKAGVKGITVKVTEADSYTSPVAATQISRAKAAGMAVSVYHYAWFTTTSQAAAEARYTAAAMKKLGLPKNTRIFADMEEPTVINDSGVKANLQAYFNALDSLGYHSHGLYTSMGYGSTPQMVSVVGKANSWLAGYPYNTTNKDMWNSDYGAWQFSSNATLTGASSSSVLDVSHDYTGLLTGVPPVDEPINYGKYVTVTQNSGSAWSSLSNGASTPLTGLYRKTYLAKTITYTSNGYVYYALYSSNGKFVGYVNTGYGTEADNVGGVGFSYGKYVTVTSNSGSVWQNFSWQQKSTIASHTHNTYLAKYAYHAYNGSTYLSLYDAKGNWQGYINAGNTEVCEGRQGIGYGYGQYVTITANTGSIWGDFSWNERAKVADHYHETFLAKYAYRNYNGSTYLSLYDKDGTWLGYLNSGNVRVNDGKAGAAFTINQYVTITDKTGNIFSDFSWTIRNKTSKYYHQTLMARYVYCNFNGFQYYSLYDANNKWVGYMNVGYAKAGAGKQGGAIAYDKTVRVTGKTGSFWGSFDWQERNKVSAYTGQKIVVPLVYYHSNGFVYLSAYDTKGHWLGYLNAGNTDAILDR
ncbi:GH25 family lysozyme [Lacticaseibacillus mingshuiensis]|uniref:GH25 family lysozyme n=1 Tax=Lacticaseibacillus mingshuiensis TaxID=2799574 RepID=A0ABW4CHF4_9LACO|nr:GH25 family lysozyme [Lacticaseibacillus mingshuiensis]